MFFCSIFSSHVFHIFSLLISSCCEIKVSPTKWSFLLVLKIHLPTWLWCDRGSYRVLIAPTELCHYNCGSSLAQLCLGQVCSPLGDSLPQVQSYVWHHLTGLCMMTWQLLQVPAPSPSPPPNGKAEPALVLPSQMAVWLEALTLYSMHLQHFIHLKTFNSCNNPKHPLISTFHKCGNCGTGKMNEMAGVTQPVSSGGKQYSFQHFLTSALVCP